VAHLSQRIRSMQALRNKVSSPSPSPTPLDSAFLPSTSPSRSSPAGRRLIQQRGKNSGVHFSLSPTSSSPSSFSRARALKAHLEAATARARAALKTRMAAVQDTMAAARASGALSHSRKPQSQAVTTQQRVSSAMVTGSQAVISVPQLLTAHVSFAAQIISVFLSGLFASSPLVLGCMETGSGYQQCAQLLPASSNFKLPALFVPAVTSPSNKDLSALSENDDELWPRCLTDTPVSQVSHLYIRYCHTFISDIVTLLCQIFSLNFL
jgi:hypothetical protein